MSNSAGHILLLRTWWPGNLIGFHTKRLNVTPPRRDGVEAVQFTKPGTYLVICARKNHFFNPATQKFEMFGYVRVLPDFWW
jgi:hypothetical protein